MDKLEFDARLARLERRVSAIMALLVLVLLAAGALGLFFTRAEVREQATVAVEIPSPMPTPPLPVEAAVAPVHAFVGSMETLRANLVKARDLSTQGLINADDFVAKKAQLPSKPLKAVDFGADIETATELSNEGVLTSAEYEILKKKILKTGE